MKSNMYVFVSAIVLSGCLSKPVNDARAAGNVHKNETREIPFYDGYGTLRSADSVEFYKWWSKNIDHVGFFIENTLVNDNGEIIEITLNPCSEETSEELLAIAKLMHLRALYGAHFGHVDRDALIKISKMPFLKKIEVLSLPPHVTREDAAKIFNDMELMDER